MIFLTQELQEMPSTYPKVQIPVHCLVAMSQFMCDEKVEADAASWEVLIYLLGSRLSIILLQILYFTQQIQDSKIFL